MLQGNSMGVEKCQELLNQNPNTEQVVKDILNEFITFQTDNIEQMKKFLQKKQIIKIKVEKIKND